MHILLVNDDGVHAQGIRELACALSDIAQITIVAPDVARSGASSQITSSVPIRLKHLTSEDLPFDLYSCTGTPVDCVKLALNALFAEQKPDLIVSGINHGRNDGICTLYSGTIGAALEGAIAGVPSIAFSLNNHHDTADFSHVCAFARKFIPELMQRPFPVGSILNINFPKDKPKGIKWARQGTGRFVDEYMPATTPHGSTVYWMQGHQIDPAGRTDTDHFYLEEGYATISPVQLDMTDYDYLQRVTSEWGDHPERWLV